MTTTETVKALYDAFAQGNISFILDHVSEDFTWQDPSNASLVPHGGLHKGREGFRQFFQQLGGDSQTRLWQVDNYTAEGNTVVAEGKHGIVANNTGKYVETEWTMIWRFKDGKPVAGRAHYNTAEVEKAFT